MRIAGFLAVFLAVLFTSAACARPAAPAAPPSPAAFVTSNLGVGPDVVRPGEDTVVRVTVTNTGGQQGTYKVVLKVDGETAKTQDVILAGGASRRVLFNLTMFITGTHTAAIDQLSVTFMVQEG